VILFLFIVANSSLAIAHCPLLIGH
jgi:hypothetical protein